MKYMFSVCMAVLLAAASAQAAPTAFVTIPPQKYFVDRISGGTVPVSIMVPPGANPHAFEPKPRQMAALAEARLYFTIGDTFDQTWLKRLISANPDMLVVHTAEGIAKMDMPEDDDADHEAHEEHHEHGGQDPHIWLDPALVRIQAKNILDGLSKADPEHAREFAANAAAFGDEIDRLDREIRAILAPIPPDRRSFLVFHPTWGYFARAYGLTQIAIEVEGKEPSPRELARIIEKGRESGARVVFVQPQFSEKSAKVIADQIGARVVRLDPLAENWAENLRQAAQAFAEAMQ